MFTFTRSNRPLKVVKINDIVSSWIRFILFFSGIQSRDDNVQRFSIFSTILFFYGGTVGIHGVLYGIDKKKNIDNNDNQPVETAPLRFN